MSLFRRLSDAHPIAVVDLNELYRMNQDIMLLSNKLIYSGRLRCGNDAIAKRGLHIPSADFMHELHKKSACTGDKCWLKQLMDPKSENFIPLSYSYAKLGRTVAKQSSSIRTMSRPKIRKLVTLPRT